MVEAWVKRNAERQTLRGELLQDLLAEEDERGDPSFLLKAAQPLCQYLQQRRLNTPRHISFDEEPFFLERILLRVQDFARSQAEQDAFIAELLVKMLESASLHFGAELRREEMYHPNLIFHAPSGMYEVPL